MIVLALCGGLGIFLLGMRHLSGGLQSASGEGLKRFMGMATGNKPLGVATGVATTVIVQSSSIMTVMLVGFVTSGLMQLSEAINVLIGANIGTTFTVWLMAFAPSPELLGLGTFCAGAALYFPLKRSRWRYVGQALVGLGLVFLGMHFMKEGVAPIKSSPELSASLGSLRATTFAQACLVALVSALFTAVVQSSAASILIFMTFASQGIITYETALASLFGANVGTTATGWLASLGGTSAAKRVAMAHTLTNVVGSLVCLPLVLPVFAPLGKALFPGWETSPMAPIAVTDTLFSIVRGAIFYPLVNRLAALLAKLVPESEDEKPHLCILEAGARMSPVIACAQAEEEVYFMAESVRDLMESLRSVLRGEGGEKAERHIFKREDILDRVQSEITTFLGEVMLKRLSPETAEHARRLMRLADEFESISDEPPAILKALGRAKADGQELSGSDLAMFLDIHDRASEMAVFLREEIVSFRNLAQWREKSADLKERIYQARQTELMRVGNGGTDAVAVLAMLDALNAYDRIRSYAMNIAETCAGGKKQHV